MKKQTVGKRALFLAAFFLICSGIALFSLKPQHISCVPSLSAAQHNRTGHTVLDLGARMQVKHILWKNPDGLAVIGSNDGRHLWVFFCSISEQRTEQRSIVTLLDQETYYSAVVLQNQYTAIVTNRRILYLDESLQEKRSVYFKGLDSIQNASLNASGTKLAYINQEGLFCYNLFTRVSQQLVSPDGLASDRFPITAAWIDEETVSYQCSSAQQDLSCGLASSSGETGGQFYPDSGACAAFGDRFVSMQTPGDPSLLRIRERGSNKEICYEIKENVLCALAESNDAIFPITLSKADGTAYLNRIDYDGGAFTTIFSLEAKDGVLNSSTVAVSSDAKLAVELCSPGIETNCKLLVVEMNPSTAA